MNRVSLAKNEDGLGRVWLIVIIAVSVIIVGCIGYEIGKNQAESKAKTAYDQKTESLQNELDEAKSDAQSGISDSKEAVSSLQDEKNKLEEQVAEQQKKIDELEDKLEDAQSQNTPPTTETQTPNQ